jgi:exodeoxyribonuclease VII small subunit
MNINEPVNFQSGLEELETITAKFENGEVGLEESIPLFKRGMYLAKFLKERLSSMETEIQEVKNQFKDSNTSTKSVDSIRVKTTEVSEFSIESSNIDASEEPLIDDSDRPF